MKDSQKKVLDIKKEPKLHELEIACAILDTNIRQLSLEWGCSGTHIRQVCKGWTTSERIEELVEKIIQEAKEVVPFSYPTNEHLNEQ